MSGVVGSVTVTENLDYEIRQTYELTIRATDVETGSYAEAIVLVSLEVTYKYTLYRSPSHYYPLHILSLLFIIYDELLG